MSNLDFYIVHVVSSEKNRPETDQLLNKEHLDNLLLQGLASGESIVEGASEAIEVTEQWWDEKRAALKKDLAKASGIMHLSQDKSKSLTLDRLAESGNLPDLPTP
jgi:hypothetical protein